MISLLESVRLHKAWTNDDTNRAEEDLLASTLSDTTAVYEILDVSLSSQRSMSTLKVTPKVAVPTKARRQIQADPILLLHGYACGKASWFRLLPLLLELQPLRNIYAIDLPGIGRSSPMTAREAKEWMKGCSTEREKEARALEYYLSAIEEWMSEMKLSRVVLLGHSFGAYLAVNYAYRRPQAVSRLILSAPVGLRRDLAAPSPSLGTFAEEAFFPIWRYAKITPNSYLRTFGTFLLYVASRTCCSTDLAKDLGSAELVDLFWRYEYSLMRAPSSLDFLMRYCIRGKGRGMDETADLLEKLSNSGGEIPITIVRGEREWVWAPLLPAPRKEGSSSRIDVVILAGKRHDLPVQACNELYGAIEAALAIES